MKQLRRFFFFFDLSTYICIAEKKENDFGLNHAHSLFITLFWQDINQLAWVYWGSNKLYVDRSMIRGSKREFEERITTESVLFEVANYLFGRPVTRGCKGCIRPPPPPPQASMVLIT